jgi:tetratricopeptide (TPR) repeat protein
MRLRVVVLALLVACPAHGSSALELVKIARAHEVSRQDDLALKRYMDALAIDPTCDEAYLGLGALRARRGDLREAERVYSVALEHRPQLREARTARAFVRRALGATEDAIDDLLTASEDDVTALRTIATWHGEDGQVPAQLATWRRIAARAETGEVALQNEARTMVRALAVLVATADPVAAPPEDASPLRRWLGALARRGKP